MHFVALKTDRVCCCFLGFFFYCRLKRLVRKQTQALGKGYKDLPVLSGILTPNTNTFSTPARSLCRCAVSQPCSQAAGTRPGLWVLVQALPSLVSVLFCLAEKTWPHHNSLNICEYINFN